MFRKFYWLIITACFLNIISTPLVGESGHNLHRPYERNSNVSIEVWEMLKPNFLPIDSPLKKSLDSIFKKRNVLKSKKKMRNAGFLLISPSNKIIVGRHYKLRGYLIKAYLEKGSLEEWYWWQRRVNGANIIRDSIKKHGFEAIMKVPRKWIYPLPITSEEKDATRLRNFILVVEDCLALDSYHNHKAYKKKMTTHHLDALYTMLTENSLIDSVYPDNVPFCEDGKMAFLDTEHTLIKEREVPLSALGQHLSKEMIAHWEQVLIHGVH